MSDHVHGPDCAHGHGAPLKLGAVGGKEPCPCGSGKKYKHCCYQKDAAAAATAARPEAQASAESGAAEESHAEAKAPGKPKAPAIARGPVMPPRNPPHGAAKALNRRSGHR